MERDLYLERLKVYHEQMRNMFDDGGEPSDQAQRELLNIAQTCITISKKITWLKQNNKFVK